MNKEQVIKKMGEDFSYTEEDLKEWEFIEIEQSNYQDNIFFDGNYVFFAEDKIVWY